MLFPNQQPNSSLKPTALVIDKDADIHRSIHIMLGKEYDVHHAYFPRLALSLLRNRRFNVVFTSLDMGSSDEMPELQRSIESISRDKGIPLIALADGQKAWSGLAACINKPLEGEHLLSAMRTAMMATSNAVGEETE